MDVVWCEMARSSSTRSPLLAALAAYQAALASDNREARQRAAEAVEQAIHRELSSAHSATRAETTLTVLEMAGSFACEQLGRWVLAHQVPPSSAPEWTTTSHDAGAGDATEISAWIQVLTQIDEAKNKCHEQAWLNRRLWPRQASRS
jgi:hypothetical protein